MFRLTKIINHLDQSTNTNSATCFSTFNISDEYICRLVQKLDQPAVNEICESIYGGQDFLHRSFDRFLNDPKCIIFGIEYKPTSQIVATQAFKIMDAGVTGFGFGGRTHKNHRGKGIYVPFSKWCNKEIKQMYPALKRIRGTAYDSNKVSLHVSSKGGSYPVKDFDIVYGHIQYPSRKSNAVYKDFIITPQKMAKILLSISRNVSQKEKNANTFQIIDNVDVVISLLMNEFNKTAMYIDWKVFDLSIGQNSIKEAKAYLIDEMAANRLKTLTNETFSTLAMIYNDEREKWTQLHIYGRNSDGLSAFVMINKLYLQWKSEMDSMINDGQAYLIFIDGDLVNNYSKMDVFRKEFDTVVLTNKIIA